MIDKKALRPLVNLFHEVGHLSSLPRSGFAFLGSGEQSVAEHSYRMSVIASILAKTSDKDVDELRLLHICLFHDFHEARIGDHNYVQKRYLSTDMPRVFSDIKKASPFGDFIVGCIEEFEEGESHEINLAHDADQLDLILLLKKEFDNGNKHAEQWYTTVKERLVTEEGKSLGDTIWEVPFYDWWHSEYEEPPKKQC
jgi:putative hydrolases of HD superfamily